jgi:hypothetical protein
MCVKWEIAESGSPEPQFSYMTILRIITLTSKSLPVDLTPRGAVKIQYDVQAGLRRKLAQLKRRSERYGDSLSLPVPRFA